MNSFYVEVGHKHYGPFETATAAKDYVGRLGLGFGEADILEFRGSVIRSEEITERTYTEGVPQPDGSILFPPATSQALRRK